MTWTIYMLVFIFVLSVTVYGLKNYLKLSVKMTWILYTLVGLLVFTIATYVYLPNLLTAMGLHRHYTIPDFDLKGRRALIVCTSHDKMGDKDTGAFGSEFTVPYYAFVNAGLDVDMASIQGGEIPIQPWSWTWPLATADDRRFMADDEAMRKLKDSKPISEINPSEYDVIFMAGGWGAAYDLAQSAELAEVITKANAEGKILGSVCHGALGLVSAKDEDGQPLVKGRRVTGVTNGQINAFGIAITPKHPETELREIGAIYEAQHAWRDFFATHTTIDGNLVTGQNQNSGYETAHRILEKLATERNE